MINLNGDAQVTHEAGSPYLDANASWTDAVDGSGTILASGQVNTGTPGSYVLSFNYTDAAGNAAQTVTRTVQVVDSTAPVISLLGDANITHEAGNVYLDANASWTMRWMEAEWLLPVAKSMPVCRDVMCLVMITPMQQAMPPRRSSAPFMWWTQPLRLSVYLGMPILRTREEVRTLMPMQVGQMRWMEAEQYWQADSKYRNSWKLCVKF